MADIQIPQEILDKLAKGEVDALLDGLEDEEMRKNPAFLAKVRQFLKDNGMVATPKLEGLHLVQREASKIPDLVGDEHAV